MELTNRRLRELITYEPVTGEFFDKKWNRVGWVKSNGRLYIQLEGKRYVASRIAWLWMRGYLPPFQITHLNGIEDDDRWRNLRPKHDVVFFKSVQYEGMNQWSARICVMDKIHHLGYFREPKDAHAAYRKAMNNWTQYLPIEEVRKIMNKPRWV